MSPILGVIASSISGRLWEPQGAYDALSTVTVPSGGAASITFAAIPQGYKHLQVRAIARTNNTSGDSTQDYLRLKLNNNSGSNYANHSLLGDGASATAQSFTTQTSAYIQRTSGNGATAGVFGTFVLDLLDYQNTSKNKTLRSLGGVDNNGSGRIYLTSNLWMNTSAVTQLDISAGDGSLISQHSQFTLYGVR